VETAKRLTFALAGNANVGKSVIFNQLTGLNQVIGNWPGKTVERAEGLLHFKGQTVNIIDLPGIYSLSTFSMEEVVTRDYIALERPDVIIDVVDASALERNLYLTIQLLELGSPMVLALNQMDFAAKKGIEIDVEKLSQLLGMPVVPTVATTGKGIEKLLSEAVDVAEHKAVAPSGIRFGKEIEGLLEKLEAVLLNNVPEICRKYPARWLAIKLFERDDDITKKILAEAAGGEILGLADMLVKEVEQEHGEPSMVVIASERYGIASRIAKEVTRIVSPPKVALEEKMSAITAHRILGYPILALVMAAMFAVIFIGGNALSGFLEGSFEDSIIPAVNGALSGVLSPLFVDIIGGGLIAGIVAGISVALPYIVPFYVLLSILEDSGYLPRAAFLMDNLMHKIGLHGKAFIPLLLGYGCSVPACIGCRILETDRERFLAGFVVVLIPCAARTVIILGLVGQYVGLPAALALYAFDLALVFALGRIAFKALPGEPVGLVMEMPPYKRPSVKNVLMKTWARTREFTYVALPWMVGGSIILVLLKQSGSDVALAHVMAPLIGGWLGLPALAGIPLIFGVFRKELALILLAELIDLAKLSSVQMIVFTMVTMIYVPCVATIATMRREFGWRRAVAVTIIDILLALLLGGLAFHILSILF